MNFSPDLLERIIERACQIQQIASPTFNESERAQFVLHNFETENLDSVHMDETGNVHARIRGNGNARPLVISAHLDTVFPLNTDLTLTRTPNQLVGPGIGDNSMGVASLFGLIWMLRAQNHTPAGDIYFVANVCEEGLGNLRGMHTVVDHYADAPAAYIVLEGMGLGVVFHRGLGVQRYKIWVHANGGHSWADYGKPSAIHEIARVITKITDLSLPKKPRTSLNIGVVHGGTSINTLAADASLELDLRSEGQMSLQLLCQQVEDIVHFANHDGVVCCAEVIGQRPSGEISVYHPLIQLAIQALQSEDLHPETSIGSTDANIPLSRGYPAVCLGLTTGMGSHTQSEFIQIEPLGKGISALYRLVMSCENLI